MRRVFVDNRDEYDERHARGADDIFCHALKTDGYVGYGEVYSKWDISFTAAAVCDAVLEPVASAPCCAEFFEGRKRSRWRRKSLKRTGKTRLELVAADLGP